MYYCLLLNVGLADVWTTLCPVLLVGRYFLLLAFAALLVAAPLVRCQDEDEEAFEETVVETEAAASPEPAAAAASAGGIADVATEYLNTATELGKQYASQAAEVAQQYLGSYGVSGSVGRNWHARSRGWWVGGGGGVSRGRWREGGRMVVTLQVVESKVISGSRARSISSAGLSSAAADGCCAGGERPFLRLLLG